MTAKTGNKNFPRDGCKSIRLQNCLLDDWQNKEEF